MSKRAFVLHHPRHLEEGPILPPPTRFLKADSAKARYESDLAVRRSRQSAMSGL